MFFGVVFVRWSESNIESIWWVRSSATKKRSNVVDLFESFLHLLMWSTQRRWHLWTKSSRCRKLSCCLNLSLFCVYLSCIQVRSNKPLLKCKESQILSQACCCALSYPTSYASVDQFRGSFFGWCTIKATDTTVNGVNALIRCQIISLKLYPT